MTPGNAPLRRYIKGNGFFSEVTTENLNQTVDALDQLRHDVTQNREPLRVGDAIVTQIRLGTITGAGPNHEIDKTNNSYWIAPQQPDPSLAFDDALTLLDEDLPEVAEIFLATNLSERSDQHGLKTDETLDVLLFGVTTGSFPTTTFWFFCREGSPVRYGKIQSVGPCNAYAAVIESDRLGNFLDPEDDQLITVFPTVGGCDETESGFCYSVGDVIAYLPTPEDRTGGIQVGAYKRVSMGFQCGTAMGAPTNLAHLEDVTRIEPYLTDFYIGPSSICGTGFTNLAQLNWRGFMVALPHTGGGSISASNYCGATNTAGTGGVKVLNFDTATDNTATISSYPGTNGALIAFDVSCASTTANVPTLGGSPCFDNSLPNMATIKGFFPVGITIDASDPGAITVSQDPDTCVITVTFPTMRCVVPFT